MAIPTTRTPATTSLCLHGLRVAWQIRAGNRDGELDNCDDEEEHDREADPAEYDQPGLSLGGSEAVQPWIFDAISDAGKETSCASGLAKVLVMAIRGCVDIGDIDRQAIGALAGEVRGRIALAEAAIHEARSIAGATLGDAATKNGA